ncbi:MULTISPECIES: efflux RND transporter permease subunit [Aliiglaciecola]|uniref:efflux RND transporter permease subunit n=1 Tax=Aliiglaciecola TaxID=1406885 RepID=UPI001C08429C|nr:MULTISPECIES: efflux RND transporter permease subunit [Aliiglaciecola]MBU2879018.1 efflux RND transporter permease subunit [Aliiglaciecola lipolytica]MDO6710716.1 efflux RND transporter permease subunit [Aliiglaciecola sp. 2_MG-2023]MDO6751876.1 efflux RND transporter permease subunit [Aliiglaciecola sp. 1_MG-2023]
MDIARYAMRTPVNIWLFIVVFILGGLIALSEIGRLENPAFTIKQVKVITAFPGASAQRVEEEVTEPLEIAIQQMSQLYRLTSISSPGQSEITVEVQRHYDSKMLPQIWDELRKRLGDMSGSLPVGAQEPQVFDDFGDVYGLYYALVAPDFTPFEMREFARIIRRQLLTTEGVAKVEVNGVMQEQVVAYIDPYLIAGLGMSFPDIISLFEDNLKPFNSGRIQVDGKKIRLLVENPADRLEELSNLSLVIPGTNRSVRIKDIARLELEPAEIQPSMIRYQGSEAITLAVSAIDGVNIVEVGQHVRKTVDGLLDELPLGMTLTPIYDQAKIVDDSVGGFITNLIMSVVVVSLTLWLFMGWRSATVVSSVLVITVLGTVMIMWLMGIQLQRISLGAMVIAMGMLVDNAIVVAEGMMLKIRGATKPEDAASYVVKRTQWPLLGATVIGIAAFSGIGLSDDATGEFLYSLFVVVLVSLLLSWVLAVTVVPVLGGYVYKSEKVVGTQQSLSGIQKGFLHILHKALRFRWVTLISLVLITVIAFASFGFVKQGFFPSSNTPIFFIHYWGPQNQDIRYTEQKIELAEKRILDFEGIESVTSFVGRGADRFTLTYAPQANNESYGMLFIRAKSLDVIEQLAPAILEKIKPVDLNAEFYLERMQFGPGSGAKLQVRFSGPDPLVLRDLAAQAIDIYQQDGETRDIRHDWRDKGLALNAHYDEFNAGMSGISRADFNDAIQYASDGLSLGQIRDGDYSYPIKAKMATAGQTPIEAIQNNQVWSSQQRVYIPFQQVSKELELVNEEVLIQRRNRIRTITVNAEPDFGQTAGEVFDRIRPVMEAIDLPDGYHLEWGGEYESSQEAQEALGKGLPAGFLVMFLISVLLFGRVKQPLIIWMVVPMAVVGVVAGLLAADMPFGFMSLLGFLSLFGMLIKNAIVLIEEIDLLIDEGQVPKLAITNASLSRLRPVSLAAITTILGMAPLLFDAFFADMAVTIMGGLAFATVLTLIAVPVLYSVFFNISYRK